MPPFNDVTIRLLEPSDSIEDLTSLIRRAYSRLKGEGLRFVATYQDETKTRERCAHGECWLAVRDGTVLGTVVLANGHREHGCAWYERADVNWFEQFAVEPECQGRGIGRALLAHIEERAAEQGWKELACDTAEQADHVIGMYEKWGYRIVDRVDWDITNYRSVILSKSL